MVGWESDGFACPLRLGWRRLIEHKPDRAAVRQRERIFAFSFRIETKLGEHGGVRAFSIDFGQKATLPPVNTLDRALLLSPYLIDHARIALDALGLQENHSTARRVLAWIKSGTCRCSLSVMFATTSG